MSATVYLVRHGRTALNAEGRFRGRLNPPLDDRGFLDAARAASLLKDARLVVVLTSPLLRAVQTAEFVARAANVRSIVEPDLIDLDHGAWQGLARDEARALDPAEFETFNEDPVRSRPPGGEALADLERRVLDALHRAADGYLGAPIAAVSHEIPIRLVLSAAARLEPRSRMWSLDLPTGSVSSVRVAGSDVRLDGAWGRVGGKSL
jgi:broad specificity phosphatase PhoE